MKKLFFFALLLLGASQLKAQENKADLLQDLEKNKAGVQNLPDNQIFTTTATLKSSSRLFGTKDDLTSVILIIPSDSTVTVLDSDSTYLHVIYEDNEGYIFKRHAVVNRTPVNTSQTIQVQQAVQEEQPAQEQEEQPAQEQQESRFSYLESKYGSGMAARLMAGKIWKGMDAEMVSDSWGTAEKINRVINGNIIKEEWIFKNTWLYFENNRLVEWGSIRK
jgi:hypothetical protein